MKSVTSFLQNIAEYAKSFQDTTQIETVDLKKFMENEINRLEKLKELDNY
jgi:hypothetical protein